jgi:hypothetical protein
MLCILLSPCLVGKHCLHCNCAAALIVWPLLSSLLRDVLLCCFYCCCVYCCDRPIFIVCSATASFRLLHHHWHRHHYCSHHPCASSSGVISICTTSGAIAALALLPLTEVFCLGACVLALTHCCSLSCVILVGATVPFVLVFCAVSLLVFHWPFLFYLCCLGGSAVLYWFEFFLLITNYLQPASRS